jgi:SpoVK/Ycf46/Vps4 family AAA+-type ATPase
MQFSIITSDNDEVRNDEIMDAIHAEADSNHMLKGEKFALSGEFLPDTDDDWSELVINDKDRLAIRKSMDITGRAGGNSRGLLFVGPPGTGKTKAGRTIMNDTDNTFIWVSARDFMYGMPSSILALAFDMARKLAPTVLFMEDVDKSLDKDMMKTELDGLKQNKGLMTILTTNHPETLPKALIDRPGRFHHVILFDLPDASQRRQMFKLWAGDISEKVLDGLVKATDGFSGAHINHLVEYSQTIAEDEDMDIGRALVESLQRMSDQIDLVTELSQSQTKELFNEEDLRQVANGGLDKDPPTLEEILQVRDEMKAEVQSDEEKALEELADILAVAKGEYR